MVISFHSILIPDFRNVLHSVDSFHDEIQSFHNVIQTLVGGNIVCL